MFHSSIFFPTFPTVPTFPGLGVPLPVAAASFRSRPGALAPGALRRVVGPRLAPGAAAAAAPRRRGAERRGDGRGAGAGQLQGPWGAVDLGMSWGETKRDWKRGDMG